MNIPFHKEKLYIIADFDHTLTTKNSQNCWGILSQISDISPNYIKESKKNNDYYLPIEQDDSLKYNIKNAIMHKWYENHLKMLIKYKFTEKDIITISHSNDIILRKGVVEFLTYTYKNDIPVIIISAGISQIIEGVLQKNKCFFSNIYIISNILKFKQGKISSLRNKIIHSLNKDNIDIPYKVKEVLKNKNEVILLGDNIGDILMKTKDNQKVFKIGFLNYDDNLKLKKFQQYFDVVYDNNNDFFDVKELLQNHLKNNIN